MGLLQYNEDKKNNPMVEVFPGFWQSRDRIGKELTAAEKYAIDNSEGCLVGSPFVIPMIWNI